MKLTDFEETKPLICDNRRPVFCNGRTPGRAGPSNRDEDCFVTFRIREDHLWRDGDFTGYALATDLIEMLHDEGVTRWVIYEQDTQTVIEHTMNQFDDFGVVTGTDPDTDKPIVAIPDDEAPYTWNADDCMFKFTPGGGK